MPLVWCVLKYVTCHGHRAVMWVLQEAFENEECSLELEMRNEKLGIERELPQINRELKEIGPQADGVGEQQLTAIGQQF